MPDEGCGEVLGDARALTLSDEPLTSAVEDSPVQLWVTSAQVGIPLHNLIDGEVWEQPASSRQDGIHVVLISPVRTLCLHGGWACAGRNLNAFIRSSYCFSDNEKSLCPSSRHPYRKKLCVARMVGLCELHRSVEM
jgi:hypothetical protein